MEVSGQLHAPTALPPGWAPLTLDRRLGGPQSLSGRGVKEKESQPLLGIEPRPFSPLPSRCSELTAADLRNDPRATV
jgi:hypothetical protein